MLIPTSRIWTAKLPDVPRDHLLLSLSRSDQTLFWVVGDERFGVMLTGDHAGHGFLIEKATNWSGTVIGPVELRIDPTSASNGDGAVDWHLKAEEGQLSIPVEVRTAHGFDERSWINVCPMRSMDQRCYFSSWSVGLENGEGAWIDLVSVSVGRINSPLSPAKLARVAIAGV